MMRRLRLLVVDALALCFGACSKHPVIEQSNRTLVAEIEQRAELRLPSDAKVLRQGHGGREGGGYYYWIIQSQERPEMKDKPIDIPVESSWEVLVRLLGRMQVGKPLEATAHIWEWETSRAKYRGSLVLTEKGWFLEIEEFEKGAFEKIL